MKKENGTTIKTVEGFRNELSTAERIPFTVKELADLLQKLTDAGWGDYVCQYEDGACQVSTVEIGPNGVFFHNY